MKTLYFALLFVAVSAAAAEPVDPQSANTDAAQPARTTDSTWTQKRDTGSDDASNDDVWTANGLNYETGQVCLTRGAGGLCLDASDDQ